MRYSKPINVPMVALVSAALHAGLAVLFVPVLSFLFLLVTGGYAATEGASSERWMTVAVVAPLLCGLIGLLAGLVMASLFNLFVRQQVTAKHADERGPRLAVASVSDAA